MDKRQSLITVLLISFCVFFQIIPVFRSGLNYDFGLGFWGAMGHDGIWHLSLINHIANPFKLILPIFSGVSLTNYHPLFDILIAVLAKITFIPSLFLTFQIFPILSSALFLYLSFILGKKITQSLFGGYLLVILNTLANSFGWLVSLFKFGNLGGESIFWAMQSPSNQINPPYLLSLILLLIILNTIFNHQTKEPLSLSEYFRIFTCLLFLPITKAYSAVPGFSLVGLFCLYLVYYHRQYKPLFVYVLTLICSYFLFIQYNPATQGLLIYKPFWFINSMIESPDRLFLPFLANARYSLIATGVLGPRLIAIYIVTLGLFILGNFSWRLIGLQLFTKKQTPIYYYVLVNIFVLTLIPVLFIQKSTSWNTIQFLYYALFLSNILLTKQLSNVKNTKFGQFQIILIILTSLLAFIGNLGNYLGKVPPTNLPPSELSALHFLSQLSPGIVLTVPYDPYLKAEFSKTPIPLYAYETTAYVSAFSKQIVYLEDEMNLGNSGYDYATAKKNSLLFFEQKNINQDRGFLINNQIKYIYIANAQIQKSNLNELDLYLQKIYDQDKVIIYQVLR